MRTFSELAVMTLIVILSMFLFAGFMGGHEDPLNHLRSLLSDQVLSRSFLTTQGLQNHLDVALQDLFNELDKNKDGVISVDEFKSMTVGAYAAFRSLDLWPDVSGLQTAVTGLHNDFQSRWERWSYMTRYIMVMWFIQGVLFFSEHLRSLFGFGNYKFPPVNMKARAMKCEKSVALTYDTPLEGLYEIGKCVLFTLSGMFVVRIIQAAFLFVVGVLCSNIAVMVPNKLWFNFWATGTRVAGYGILFSLGYYKIRVHGKPARREECKFFVANHVCLIEVVILFIEAGLPSFVSRLENLGIPLFSGLIKATDSILVDRNDPKSREKTLLEMIRRANDPKAPQLMVFPEGTTDNQRALFKFKRGPFEPHCPLQIVCFKLPYKHFNVAWTGQATGGNDIGDLIYRLVCQFVNRAEVHFLPVYHPSAEEKADTGLFAENVMNVMASQLGIPVSEASFEDYKDLLKNYGKVMEDSQTKTKAGWRSKMQRGLWFPFASFGWVAGRAHTFVEAVRAMTPRPHKTTSGKQKAKEQEKDE